MIDVSGSFECVSDDPVLGPALRQMADGKPFGPYADSRPHSLTGSLDTSDVMVSVELAVASGQQWLLGARVRPTLGAQANPEAMNVASGFWLALAPRAGASDWRVVRALDDGTFAGAPLRSGSLATSGDMSGAWLTARLDLRGSRAVGSLVVRGSATLLFNMDASGVANGEGFVGIGTGAFAYGAASFRNLVIAGASSTCDDTPAQGAFVTVETCDDGSNGQTFEFLVPPGGFSPANFTTSLITKADAWDEDCGARLAESDLPTRLQLCAANFSASLGGDTCGCAAFNGNGVPKASLDDVAPYLSVDLYVLQAPPLQLALSANTSLCLSIGGADAMTLFLDACAPAAAVPDEQLWWFERSFADGVLLSGPLHTQKNNWVVDQWSFGEDIGSTVKADGWNKGSNQIFGFPWPALRGIIRNAHFGTCLGACRPVT